MPFLMSPEDFENMGGPEILALAKQIYRQVWDRKWMAQQLGGEEDVIQYICQAIVEIKAENRILKPGSDFVKYVAGIARGGALRNWMFESKKSGETNDLDDDRESDIQQTPPGQEEMANFWAGEVEEIWFDQKIERLNLNAFERLLLAQADNAGEIAEYFDLAERTVRKKRQELFTRLRKKYDLPEDFFRLRVKRQQMLHPKSKRMGRKKTKAESEPLCA